MTKIKRNLAAEKIAKTILDEYDVETVEDMQSAANSTQLAEGSRPNRRSRSGFLANPGRWNRQTVLKRQIL